MDKGNNLSPRLVSLAKDKTLEIFLDSWDFNMTFKEIKSSLLLNIENDSIVINKRFIEIPKEDLCKQIEDSYRILISLIVQTLNFVGRPIEGLDAEWNHPHTH